MKEAFWGVLIVLLGLFGIVVVNIFQNVTVDNDRVYYLIKESTEASAYDALDLTYYRLSGKLRIVEDKFVENLTRRFAENVTIGDYRIIVEDINEMPPKVSLRVRSGVATLSGEKFGIVNRVDGILETKYNLDDVLDFLGITEEEWNRKEENTIEKDEDTGENICKVITNNKDEIECITGDIKFDGFEEADIEKNVCQDEAPKGNKEIVVKYKVCDCGKWVEESETLTANPTKVGNEWVYTWTFNKVGVIRAINETLKSRVRIDVCTTNVGEMVPNDILKTKPKEDGSAYEPSKDNSKYIDCPATGIKIPVGMKFIMHPKYTPNDSINRNLEWSTTDDTIIGVQGSNPVSTCILNKDATNCFSTAVITAKKVGTAYVNVKTTRNQTASCKIEVFDGNVDSVSCHNKTINYDSSGIMERDYYPKNSTYVDLKWSISNTNIATIDEKTGAVVAKNSGSTTVTVTAPNGKSGTCTLTVKSKPSSGGGSSGGGGGGGTSTGGSCSCMRPVCVEYENKCQVRDVIGTYQCGINTRPIYTTAPCGVSCKTSCHYDIWSRKTKCSISCTTRYCTKLTGYQNTPRYCTGVHKEYTCTQSCIKMQNKPFPGKVMIERSSNGCFWSSWCSTSQGSCNYSSGSSC